MDGKPNIFQPTQKIHFNIISCWASNQHYPSNIQHLYLKHIDFLIRWVWLNPSPMLFGCASEAKVSQLEGSEAPEVPPLRRVFNKDNPPHPPKKHQLVKMNTTVTQLTNWIIMIQLLCFGDCQPSLTDGCMVWGLLALRWCLWCSAVTGHEFLLPKLQKVGSHLPLRCWPWRGYSSNTSFTLRPEKPVINWVWGRSRLYCYTTNLQIDNLFICLPAFFGSSFAAYWHTVPTRRHSFMVTPVP